MYPRLLIDLPTGVWEEETIRVRVEVEVREGVLVDAMSAEYVDLTIGAELLADVNANF